MQISTCLRPNINHNRHEILVVNGTLVYRIVK
jgi:hypothetical protein